MNRWYNLDLKSMVGLARRKPSPTTKIASQCQMYMMGYYHYLSWLLSRFLYIHTAPLFVWYTEDLYSITILCRDHGGCFKENLNAPPAGIGLSALKSRQRQETCEHSHMHPQTTAPYSQFGSIYTKSSYIYIWQQTISRIIILQKRFIDCTLKENKSNKLLNKLILHF